MNIKKLKEPFEESDIKWRVGSTTKDKSKGMALAYVDARDIMDKLDSVVGAENWQCTYPFVGCCSIGIKIGSGWVWKSNCAGETNVEADKGQASDSFKRAAVVWGIGRYLYNLKSIWAPLKAQGKSHVFATTPLLPDWAKPKNVSSKETSPNVMPGFLDRSKETIPDKAVAMLCIGCSASISAKVAMFSMRNFRKHLCMKCQNKKGSK